MDSPAARAIITFGVMILSVIGVFIARRLFPPAKLRENNEYVGFTYAFVGLVYGVYLAFTVVVVWEQFNSAEQDTETEAAHLTELYRDAGTLPPAQRAAIQAQIARYTRSVIDREWPAMARGEVSDPDTVKQWNMLWRSYYAVSDVPLTQMQTIYLQESLRQLNEIGVARRERLLSARSALHPIMWTLLLFGGVGMIIYSYLIAAESVWVQVAITAFLAAMVVFSILIVGAMEHPYAGDVSVEPDAFIGALKSLQIDQALNAPHAPSP